MEKTELESELLNAQEHMDNLEFLLKQKNEKISQLEAKATAYDRLIEKLSLWGKHLKSSSMAQNSLDFTYTVHNSLAPDPTSTRRRNSMTREHRAWEMLIRRLNYLNTFGGNRSEMEKTTRIVAEIWDDTGHEEEPVTTLPDGWEESK